MTRITTALTVGATVAWLMAANLHAGEAPKEVREWLKFSAGAWEVRVKGDDNNETQAGTHSAELAAGGTVLITKGKQIGTGHELVAVDAWESGKKKLVTSWYTSDGAHARTEYDVTKAELKGPISGTDDDGAAITGTVIVRKIDENTFESTIEGTLGGNDFSFTLIAKRKK